MEGFGLPHSRLTNFSEVQGHLPRDSAAHGGLGPPESITNPDHPPQTCPRASLTEAIPHLRPLLPDDSRLCQVDTQG